MEDYDPERVLEALKPWQDLAAELERAGSAFADERFVEASASGMVAAEVDGRGALLGLRIDPAALRGSHAEGIGEDTVEAVRSARSVAAAAGRSRMDEIRDGVRR